MKCSSSRHLGVVEEKRCIEFSVFSLDLLDNIEHPFQARLFLFFDPIFIKFFGNVAPPFKNTI